MAKKSSTRSGRQKSKADSVTPDSVVTDTLEGAGEMGGDTVVLGDDTLGEDAVAIEPGSEDRVTIEPGDTTPLDAEDADPAQTEILAEDAVTDPSVAETAPAVEKRGTGWAALLLGGAVVAALGYGAALFGFADTNDTSATDAALSEALAAIEAQQGTITALEAEVAALAAVEPPVMPEVDLSGVETSISGVASDVAGLGTTIDTLTGRIVALEERPIFTGEVSADTAAMTEAVEALEARIAAEQAAAAEAMAAAVALEEAAAAEAQAAAQAAEAAVAEAEARAAEQAAAAQTEAAITRIQAAMAAGEPFADALADLSTEQAPAALSAVSETGVATLEELQAAYPDFARAALPIALREEAGDGAADRVGAFLLGQIGGRSVEPREGDDPDAVLSRAEAAVAAGDLQSALTEIAALSDGAQAALQDWVAQVETRAAAEAALADLSATQEN